MKKLTITIALMLVVALAMPAFGASFSDVPSDHWAYNAINKLVAAGVVEGYPDGEFKGSQSMTRYEMAVMVSRALDNIVDEMDAMGEGLTTGQAEDVTAIVKSLNEKNNADSLSDAQAEEVADMVDALTFELQNELKVLGADVDALGKDVDELEAKVDAMDVPEDNIEFTVDMQTKAQVAYYGEDEKEERAVLEMLADDDAIDEDFWEDPDEFPAEERFWQEYDFNIVGNLGDAEFNLQVDTITNLFMDERNVMNYTENDENKFELDEALLEVAFNNTYVKIGDQEDYRPEDYFLDEDFEGVEVNTRMYGTDFTAFAGGNDEDNLNNGGSYGEDEMADEKYFGLTAEKDTSFGSLTGKVYHARSVVDELSAGPRNGTGDPYDNTLVSLGLTTDLSDTLSLGGEVVYGEYEEDNGRDDDDIYAKVRGDMALTEALNSYAFVEYAGEDFVAARNDLEEDFGDYTKAQIGADYQLNENNNINGHVMFAEAGDYWDTKKNDTKITKNDISLKADDKMLVNIGLDNMYGKFTNRAFAEYVENDEFEKDRNYILVGLGTEYAYDETMTMGAKLNYKDIERLDSDYTDYVYLTGFVDKQLRENISWRTEAMVIDGSASWENVDFTTGDIANDVDSGIAGDYKNNHKGNNIPDNGEFGSEEDGTGYAMTTSLNISF